MILAVLACKDRRQPYLLACLTCLLQGLAGAESLLAADGMCTAGGTVHFASFSPQLVCVPASFRQPFTIPASRTSQAFNLFFGSIA